MSAHIARGIRMMASFRRLQKGSHIATPVILSSVIRTYIENDRLVTSLVYCAIYAQLLVLRALGGASYRTGIILVVVRMTAPPATTSSALAHLVHRQWFIMHPWTRVDRWGTRPDAIYTRLCRLRRLTTNVG